MFCLALTLVFVASTYAQAPPISNIRPSLDGRIVGGRNATIEDYPYQLSLGYNGEHSCGASLIKPNVALTAAHCTYRVSPSILTVRAGTSFLNGGEVAQVLKICTHPKFQSFDYDVAVLLLNRSFLLGPSIQTISPQLVNKDIAPGTLAVVTGWGNLFPGGYAPLILQEVEVPRVSQKECKKAYPFEGEITDRMSCYGYSEGGKDACQGDSGGPLVVDGEVCGIVSWGNGCADPAYPGVYTNVADKEINDHIYTCIANF